MDQLTPNDMILSDNGIDIIENIIRQKELQLSHVENELSETLEIFAPIAPKMMVDLKEIETDVQQCTRLCCESKNKLICAQKDCLNQIKLTYDIKHLNKLIRLKELLVLLEAIKQNQESMDKNINENKFEDAISEYKIIRESVNLLPNELLCKNQLIDHMQKSLLVLRKNYDRYYQRVHPTIKKQSILSMIGISK